MNFTALVNFITTWVNDRLKERTSWDGALLIVSGISFLIFKPIATIIAYIAIVYGAWTLWKKEKG